MTWILWTLFGLMAACGFIGWCCVRVGAMSDRLDEADIEAAVEGALIAELSDISFAATSVRTAER